MKKIKKFKKNELKQFVEVDGKYNIDSNYHTFLRLRHVDDFKYDVEHSLVLYREHIYDSHDCAELLQEVNECGIKLTSEPKMNRAVKSFCMNKAREEIESYTQEKEQEKERVKQQQLQQLIDGPKNAREYVDTNYSDLLSLSTTNGRIFYNGQYSQSIIDNLINETMIKFKITKKIAKTILHDIASRHKFIEVKKNTETMNIDEKNYLSCMNYDDKNRLQNTIWNYKLFLKFNEKYKDRIKFNGLDKNEYYLNDDGKWVYINDTQLGYIYSDIEQFFNMTYKSGSAEKAFYMACHENEYHPIKEYFNRIRQSYRGSGTENAETFFIKYLGAEDNEINRHMTLKWLLAAVKMIEEEPVGEDDKPVGWDNMIILFGPQGIGKSKLIQRLFGARYTQTNIDITNEQEYVDKLNKAWVGVFEELAKFNNKEMGAIKDFLTKTDNTVRLSYARRSTFYPRHVVFVGNTNKQHFLRDYDTDYERRFWVIECNGNGHSREWWANNLTQQHIDDIWGEVLQLYDSEDYNLDLDDEDIDELKKIQLRHKSAMEDDILCDDIYKITEHKYTKIYYDSYEDFTAFVENSFDYISSTLKYYMNEIPTSWMTRLLRQKNKKFYAPIMIKYGWECLSHGHDAYRNYEVWHRKNEIENVEIETPTDEFFINSHSMSS